MTLLQLSQLGATLLSGIGIFLAITLLLVIVLLVAKRYLVSSGKVTVTINDDKKVEVESGRPLLSALATQNVFLPSACGGKGSCGQCKVRVTEGGGEILPTEAVHFTRKENQGQLAPRMPGESEKRHRYQGTRLGARHQGIRVYRGIEQQRGHLHQRVHRGSSRRRTHELHPRIYAQIKIPPFNIDYDKDIDKASIGKEYLRAWEKFGLFNLKCVNTETTVRAYSMANYPAEGDRFMLTVRIATPPFKPKPEVGFMDVNPGIASSYIFTLKPGDKVMMSGPYGDFHPIFNSKNEMMWIGGGAGMAPLRAQIMHMTKTLNTTDRVMNYFYGARALNEVFYLDDFLNLEKEFPNFHFHLALDRPDPAADAAGVKYTPGFVHQVIYDTYLKNHENPEDIEYYMCGPGPMSKAVNGMLDSLGVDPANIHYDNFGG